MNITPIIETVFALIAAVITAIVIPYIRSKTTAQQQTEINAWVRIAVSAAEQIYVGSGRGQEKKAYVINWLAEHGVTLDETRLDAMIEAAVYDLKKGCFRQEVTRSEHPHRPGKPRRDRRPRAEAWQSDGPGAEFFVLVQRKLAGDSPVQRPGHVGAGGAGLRRRRTEPEHRL